jgi:hypothetical protein
MDAMLEGELHNGKLKPLKRQADQDALESEPAGLSADASQATASQVEAKFGTHQPPGSR